MLGENHSLQTDFPENKKTIRKQNSDNKVFPKNAKRNHAFDAKIRNQKLKNAQINNEALNQ